MLSSLTTAAQEECNTTIAGKILDQSTGAALSYANVFIEESGAGISTDSTGFFLFKNQCRGHLHMSITHIGCEEEYLHLEIESDTLLAIYLNHTHHLIEELDVTGRYEAVILEESSVITSQKIKDRQDKSLGNQLESISGVRVIRKGAGLAKPIVHGLTGNRLTILNNGIAQSGQQWGADHAPEIDPLVAQKISVLKGVGSLEYPGSNLGPVLVVEPSNIKLEPHIHGQINYSFNTNGRGHTINSSIQQHQENQLAWRLNLTAKKSGDSKTAEYFLNNTGVQELNAALQLEKSYSDNWFIDFYTSTFNTEIGILRGSLIGNLTDLGFALEAEEPYYTEENFSYSINAPRQLVSHHLAKVQVKKYIDDDTWMTFKAAFQANNRREFDVRRGGRSTTPALHLLQYTSFTEFKYHTNFSRDWAFKIGYQYNFIDNNNVAGTGNLPLIPNYVSHEQGIFFNLTKSNERLEYSVGSRLDYRYQSVATFPLSGPTELVRYQNRFANVSGIAGIKYLISKRQSFLMNLGWASRSPGINELYSQGLHQGVSGIEEGNIDLDIERSLKTSFSYSYDNGSNFQFQALSYLQYIDDYIYLNPTGELRLTIRGSFPVFRYIQTDARLLGLDLESNIKITEQIHLELKYSNVIADDLDRDLAIIDIPSHKLSSSIQYEVAKAIELRKTRFENLKIELNHEYNARQNRVLDSQDFTPTPDAYSLVGLSVTSNILLGNQRFRSYISIDNLFNVSYRDYLNRLRYFADDLGRNIVVGSKWSF